MSPRVAVLVGEEQPWHGRLLALLGDGAALTTAVPEAGVVLDLRTPAAPRPGWWAFEVGLGGLAGLDAPGARELRAGRSTCLVRLVRQGQDGVQVLLEGQLPVEGDGPAEVAAALLDRLAEWPAAARARCPGEPATVPGAESRPLPSRLRRGTWRRRVRRKARAVLYREHWTLGLCHGVTPAHLIAGLPLPGPVWAPETRDCYLADPFPLEGTGRLVAERYSLHGTGSPGELVELAWSGDGRAPEVLGPGPTSTSHLSYPSAFRHDGQLWCVPESAADGAAVLWRRDDAGGWAPVRTLLEVPVVDPDLVHHDGRWWLFYAVEGPRRHEELHLAWADSLDGALTPHPANPVVRDVTAARGAGRPFVVDGRLYRPAQDCSDAYGGALTLVEVTALTPTEYRQHVVRRFAPVPPYSAGLHTLNLVDGGLVIDGKRAELSLRDLAGKVRGRLPRG